MELHGCFHTHRGHEAVVQVFIREEDSIFNEDGARSQDEREEQVDVDVVPGAAKLPEQSEGRTLTLTHTLIVKKTQV